MAENSNIQGRNRQVGTNWASEYQAASVWVTNGANGTKIIHFVGFDTNVLKNVLKAISDKSDVPSKRTAKPDMGFMYCAWKGQGDKLEFQIVTSAEDGVQQFLDSGWITMQNALIEAGVDPKKVDPLTDEIEMEMNAMTPEEKQEMIQVANQSFAELWQEYLNKMKQLCDRIDSSISEDNSPYGDISIASTINVMYRRKKTHQYQYASVREIEYELIEII